MKDTFQLAIVGHYDLNMFFVCSVYVNPNILCSIFRCFYVGL